jgi:hypothetical protein
MKTFSSSPEPEVPKPQASPTPHPMVNTVIRNEPLDPPGQSAFAADYFNLKDLGPLILEPKLDVNNMVEKIVFLEDYLSEQLKKNNMVIDKESFRSILSDIERTLGVDDRNETSYRLSRVYGFLSIVKKTQDNSSRRKALLDRYFKK